MAVATGEAYNLSAFNAKPMEEVDRDIKVRTLRLIKSKRQAKTVAPIKVILIVLAFLVVTVLMILSRVMIMELNAQISEKHQEITILDSEYVRLSAELEASTSMKSLESSAIDELGLTKIDGSQVEYMNLAGNDKIEVAHVGSGFIIAQWWESLINAIKEYIPF